MSISSKFSNSDQSNSARSSAAPVNRSGGRSSSRSGEDSFAMSLFPEYIRSRKQKLNLQKSQPLQKLQPLRDELHQLRTHLAQIEQRHRQELAQLEAAWREKLDAAIALQPSSPMSATASATAKMPRLSLQHIPTTYEVPRQLRLNWFDKSLGAVLMFLLLVVVGMVLAALSSMALSPTVLWPSVSAVIESMLPTVFVVGLFRFSAIALSNIGR